VIVVVLAFVAMEPITAATHRFLMHGPGRVLHRSHHRNNTHGWELNDLFPVAFAALVMMAMAVGFNVQGFEVLVPIGIGVTLYGVTYALVHDVYIHQRLPWLRGRSIPVLERLAAAHRVHHDRNGAPYGMLIPVIARGSRPSQRPAER
jgi:beta-carotene 3-hydroxylase